MCLGMILLDVNVDYVQVFVRIKSVGIMINADVNVKNWMIRIDVMIDLFVRYAKYY